MSPTCHSQRELMVDHLLGELDGLVAQRLEAHLDACASCAEVYARLEAGFASARRFEPEVDEEDLSRWSGRLEPFMSEPKRPPRFSGVGFWALAVGGAAVAAVVVALWTPEAVIAPPSTLAPALAEAPTPIEPVAPAREVERRKLTDHLRAVTSPDFSGEVRTPDEKTTELDIAAGFAVLDFEGGEQRKLRVVSDDVEVHVIGTRFFVEAREGAPTTVGVVSGRVEVRSRGQVEVLGAGQVRAYDASGAYTPDLSNLRSAAHHEDTFLAQAEVEPEPKPVPAAAPAPKPAPRRAPDPVGALTRAERLVREGRAEEGLRVYDRLIAEAPPGLIRDAARYERARVWGFVTGERARAARALEVLATKASPEVRRQAALARCELDAVDDRCAAAACLRALEAAGRYVGEVQALLRAWGVSGDTCVETSAGHKTDGAPRPTK